MRKSIYDEKTLPFDLGAPLTTQQAYARFMKDNGSQTCRRR
jgi:hypothetical protein